MTFGVGNVLATTVRLWARELPRFFLLTVICFVPIIAWNILMSVDAVGGALYEHVYHPLQRLHPALGPHVVSGEWITDALLGAAITLCVVGRLRDERVSIWRALGATLRRLPSIVGIALIVRLLTWGPGMVIAVLRWDENQFVPRFSLLEWTLSELLWIVLMSLFLVALPVAIAERRGVWSSIGRAFALGRGERSKVFAVKLVHTAVLVALFYGTSWVLLLSSDTAADYGRRFMVYAYVRFGIELVIASLAAVLAAVVYERLRASKEGATPTQLQTVFD